MTTLYQEPFSRVDVKTLYQVDLLYVGDVLDDCPNVSEDPLIRQITAQVQYKDLWNFGSALGVPLDDLKMITERRREDSSIAIIYDVFNCWSKKIVDPNRRSWRCVLHALNAIGYKALASEIRATLTSAS